jgi:hypothetical protein
MKSMKELEGKLSAAEQQNRMLVEQNGKFRSIILSRSSSSGEAIDDSKIVVPFISLRTQIQRIVFKFYKPNSAPRELQASATRRQQQFFDLWRDDFSDAQLLNRTRAMVFDLLNENILSSVCFGLDGFDSSENLESGLVNFEHALSSMWKGGCTRTLLAKDPTANRYPQGMSPRFQSGERGVSSARVCCAARIQAQVHRG